MRVMLVNYYQNITILLRIKNTTIRCVLLNPPKKQSILILQTISFSLQYHHRTDSTFPPAVCETHTPSPQSPQIATSPSTIQKASSRASISISHLANPRRGLSAVRARRLTARDAGVATRAAIRQFVSGRSPDTLPRPGRSSGGPDESLTLGPREPSCGGVRKCPWAGRPQGPAAPVVRAQLVVDRDAPLSPAT